MRMRRGKCTAKRSPERALAQVTGVLVRVLKPLWGASLIVGGSNPTPSAIHPSRTADPDAYRPRRSRPPGNGTSR